MLLLLKQARAFGVGVVLSTQNPVDLDYKGLSNIGTWFIGRLQTAQDIDRVIDGLGGKVGGSYSKSEIKSLLTNLNKRTFFLKSAHLDDIRLFTTRWVMSYLKGPLKSNDISKLMEVKKSSLKPQTVLSSTSSQDDSYQEFVTLDSSIEQRFVVDITGENRFRATLQGEVELHFYNQSKGIDEHEKFCVALDIYEDEQVDWDEVMEMENCGTFSKTAPSGASFAPLSLALSRDKGFKKTKRELIDWVYDTKRLTLYRSTSLRLSSKPYESMGDFKVRIKDILDDKKEIEIEKLQHRYGKKEQTLLSRLRRAEDKVEKEEADSTKSMVDTGIAILGALFGRSSSAKLGRALSKGSRAYKERGDIGRAQEAVATIHEQIEALSYELEDKIADLAMRYDVESVTIGESSLKPRKSDIEVNQLALVWVV
jgi:hypothetical protein